MTTMEATAGSCPGRVSNFRIIRRLLTYMTPFNGIMFTSLIARVDQDLSARRRCSALPRQASVSTSNAAEPGVVNWDVIWTQVKWIALAGTVVGLFSYIENYTGHYVAFRILAAFRDKFYYAMLPLAPARTAKLQSGDAVAA